MYFSGRTKQKRKKICQIINKHNFDYSESIPLLSYSLLYSEADASWEVSQDYLMRNSSENMLLIYRRTPIKKCDFNKVALYRLLLKPGPRPWTWTLESDPAKLDPVKLDSWKTWETVRSKKMIGRPHNIIYHNTKILKEETCWRAIWKNSYWGFLGIQEMWLRLRVKMNSKAINKYDCAINLTSFSDVFFNQLILLIYTSELQKGFSNSSLQLYQKETPTHVFTCVNAKFLRTLILKNINEWLLLNIYPILLFRFLEDIAEIAVCRHS